MDGQLVVRVGAVGLSWDDELIDLLTEATGLTWERDGERERVEAGPSQGVETILLTALLTSVVDDAVKTLIHRANEAIGEWRKRRLEPPEISIDVEPSAEDDQREEAE